MSYSNGRIYVDTSTDPDTGVSIYDVQRALSTSRRDLGELCTHQNINRWARFKPVILSNVISPITHSNISSNGVHFGLNIIYGSWSSFSSDISAYVGLVYGSSSQATIRGTIYKKGDWKDGVAYSRPSGGTASPYRLTDFVSSENYRFGYSRSAQPLYNWPQGSGSTAAIGSYISSLIQQSGGRSVIVIDELPDYADLDDDSWVYNQLNVPLSISGKTSYDYNSVSIPELLKTLFPMGGVDRGVVLVDIGGWVSNYKAEGQIPWGTWRQSALETSLYGQWVCLEYYKEYNRDNYCLIPGFEYNVEFVYGTSPTQPTLAFAMDGDAMGGIRPSDGYMFISFRQISNYNLSEWTITITLYKYDTETMERNPYGASWNLNSMTVVQSGATWYQKYVNVDYPSQSPAGSRFALRINYYKSGTSMTARDFWFENFAIGE